MTKYQKRISGPLLDRIDIHIEVPSVDYEKLSGDRLGETSETIRMRVQAARDIQNKRFLNGENKDIVCNADMRVGEVRQFCQLQDEGKSLMRSAMTQLNLSARVSPSVEVGPHNCRFGRGRGNPISSSGGGIAIPSEVDGGVMVRIMTTKIISYI